MKPSEDLAEPSGTDTKNRITSVVIHMPRMGQHTDCGIYACIPYLFLVLAIYQAGLIGSSFECLQFLTFGVIALIVGSDLPDIDARKAPIHDLFLITTFGVVYVASAILGGLRPFPALTLASVSVVVFKKKMPGHRGFMHTIRASMLFGLSLSVISFCLGASLVLAAWVGLSLFAGCVLHLVMDGHLKW